MVIWKKKILWLVSNVVNTSGARRLLHANVMNYNYRITYLHMEEHRVKQKTLPRISAFAWEILATGIKQMVSGWGKGRTNKEIWF